MTGASGVRARAGTRVATGEERRFGALDGLRGIAVLLVVVDHAGLVGEGRPLGAIGVTLFFVLSGFLISRTVLAARRDGRWTMKGFMADRAARLLPALVVMQSGVLVWWAVTEYSRSGMWTALAASLLYVQNLLHGHLDVGIFMHTWSLAVEEQFYVVWPLVLPWLMRCKDPLRWMASLIAGSMMLRVVLGSLGMSQQAYASLPANAFALLLGGLLVVVPGAVSPGRAQRAAPVVTLVLILVLAFMPLPAPEIVTPVFAAPLAACGVAAALSGALWLEAAVLRFVGRVSYSWYLWHWPLLLLAGEMGGGLSAVPWLILTFLVAVMSTLLVEEPLRAMWRVRTSASAVRRSAPCSTEVSSS